MIDLAYKSRKPNISKISIYLLFFCLYLIQPTGVHAQTHLSGRIIDAQTKEFLSSVSISIQGTDVGTISDEKGKFSLHTSAGKGVLVVYSLGYARQLIPFEGNMHKRIFLENDQFQLQEVEIKPVKKKYRNKNNPAVELIRQVIAHKQENMIRHSADHIQFQEYSRLSLSVVNPGSALTSNPLLKQYQFMFAHMDTLSQPGKKLWPAYLEEDVYKKYYQASPSRQKVVHQANKKVTFDDRLVNNESTSTIFKYIIEDIDLYDNDIYLLTNAFLSPVANGAPFFYKYYIKDTVYRNNQPYVQLNFEPRNNEDLLFYGSLEVGLEQNYAVTHAVLQLSRYANVNWLNSLQADFTYTQEPDGRFIPREVKLQIDFGVDYLPNSILAQHTRIFSHTDYTTAIADSVFTTPATALADSQNTAAYWEQHRPVALSEAEAHVYQNYDSLNRMPSFNRLMTLGSFIMGGYLNLGPVELGSYGTFYTRNEVEGTKIRLAGRTTAQFNERVYLAGNLSYGFGDHQWKHYGALAYALNGRSIYNFPQHSLQLSHTYDSRIPGLDFQFREEENLLLSFKRGRNNKYLYADVWRLEYVVEAKENIRLELALERSEQTAAGGLEFIPSNRNGSPEVKSITTTEAAINLRWAHHERLLDKKHGRKSIPNTFPTISLAYVAGIDGWMGSNYGYHKLRMMVEKRLILSQLGHADIAVGAGRMWGQVPYPLLFIPRANQNYGYYLTSYNLMNFIEFVSDKYVEARVDYHMHGFLLNKIPLVKTLDLREVFGLKVFYGGLSAANHPGDDPRLFDWPRNEQQHPTTFPIGRDPYIEYNIGLENIFNLFRIDYVGRLNYLNHPQVPKWGIRFRMHVSF